LSFLGLALISLSFRKSLRSLYSSKN